jgi:hypothetical protein
VFVVCPDTTAEAAAPAGSTCVNELKRVAPAPVAKVTPRHEVGELGVVPDAPGDTCGRGLVPKWVRTRCSEPEGPRHYADHERAR